MSQSEMPTMRSRRLGGELKRLREKAGLTMGDAARELQSGQPKISKIESGQQGIRPLDLDHLLTLYGVEDEEERQNFRQLAKHVRTLDWWSAQGPLLHDDMKDYLTLETDSSLIRTYETQLMPGLLQTERYMSALFQPPFPTDKARLMVETRRKRQAILDDDEVHLRAVLDVSALHGTVGSHGLMIEQLEHVLTMSQHRNVDVQVLPQDRTLTPDQYVPYTIFTMRQAPSADYVWLEHLSGSTLLEREPHVQRYKRAWEDHTAAALSPRESTVYIRKLIEEYRT
ncbi:helix-turn-helix transcriptional regulator [Streptomyces sp. B15]|uniref:helix-turn-helix domain-containing protein n=1 Tax=Streptomyces sp. B15 TaxID=1537797 RepID=UPI001B37D376|nr:helix-turn-helix transcriptional regulator [Streptomyces sp. B15]MBQ1122219.1 helix-turn-helix domain-containing protein [Streptomyces sp. B15]